MLEGYYMPEKTEEEYWNIIGRVNALHDFMAYNAREGAMHVSMEQAAAIMGFADIQTEKKGI